MLGGKQWRKGEGELTGGGQLRIKGGVPAEGQRLCEIREEQQVQRPGGR